MLSQHLWIEPVASLAEATIPTNPSSLTLAWVGVVSYLSYYMLARPGHQEDRRLQRLDQAQPPSHAPHIRPRRRVA